ncbi:hypothetical protein CXG81DRAFT_20234 [Caulochytrium protostelioides]|uniref:Uncharacterized protein n=1 Tax=Caulochytrium protostelioides TaxID=1555241 RepID=A0A4P9X3U7_9FUNG|nr:hypothetical protein CXG81DRAFT_20234 [Caulochytrium protostelioides]|eukprot:RKO99719.1 hypothetical protein CXG81DRAFT_20234 [Caulochytrium protostelioides]
MASHRAVSFGWGSALVTFGMALLAVLCAALGARAIPTPPNEGPTGPSAGQFGILYPHPAERNSFSLYPPQADARSLNDNPANWHPRLDVLPQVVGPPYAVGQPNPIASTPPVLFPTWDPEGPYLKIIRPTDVPPERQSYVFPFASYGNYGHNNIFDRQMPLVLSQIEQSTFLHFVSGQPQWDLWKTYWNTWVATLPNIVIAKVSDKQMKMFEKTPLVAWANAYQPLFSLFRFARHFPLSSQLDDIKFLLFAIKQYKRTRKVLPSDPPIDPNIVKLSNWVETHLVPTPLYLALESLFTLYLEADVADAQQSKLNKLNERVIKQYLKRLRENVDTLTNDVAGSWKLVREDLLATTDSNPNIAEDTLSPSSTSPIFA